MSRKELIKRRKMYARRRRIALAIYTALVSIFSTLFAASVLMVSMNIMGYHIVSADDIIKNTSNDPAPVEFTYTKSLSEYRYAPSINNLLGNTEEVAENIIEETVVIETEYVAKEAIDPYYGYTQEDYEYLLGVIVGEAQHCSREEQMMVGSVVLNRLNNKKYFSYANSIKEICLAPKQYACFANGTAYKTPTEENKEVAMELLKNGSILPGNVIFQALFPQGDGVYKYFEDTGTYICYKD